MIDVILARVADLARRSAPPFVLVVIVLSILPGNLRPHTGASGDVEHFLAYAGTAGALILALRTHRLSTVAVGVAMLSALAGLLETAQIWIPDRSADIGNWLASSAGALVGGLLARPLVRRLPPRGAPEAVHRGGSEDGRGPIDAQPPAASLNHSRKAMSGGWSRRSTGQAR